jgi:hypothetical protein
MKLLVVLALVLTQSAFSGEFNFNCSTGLKETTMTVSEHYIQMDGTTYTNMFPVDEEIVWRGYTFISNPWMDITIVSRLLKGETGTAIVKITDLDTYEYQVESYECVLQ